MCTGTLSGVCVWRVSAVLCCVLSDVSMNQDINFRYNFRWLVHRLVDNFPHSCISDAIGNHEGGKRNYNSVAILAQGNCGHPSHSPSLLPKGLGTGRFVARWPPAGREGREARDWRSCLDPSPYLNRRWILVVSGGAVAAAPAVK